MEKLTSLFITAFIAVSLVGCKPGVYYPRPDDTSTYNNQAQNGQKGTAQQQNQNTGPAKNANGATIVSSPFR